MHTRYAHLRSVYVKPGDRVRKGQKIGTLGTGNGQWSAHLHRDHPKRFPRLSNGKPNYNFYCIRWTRAKVQEWFADPRQFPYALRSKFDHLGLGWLEYWDYASRSSRVPFARAKSPCYHPGLDENGPGAGNADIGTPVYAVASGTVVHVYDGNGKNGGWGKMIVVRHGNANAAESKPTNTTTMLNAKLRKALKRITGVDFGAKLSDKEQVRLAAILTDREKEHKQRVAALEADVRKLTEKADAAGRALERMTRERDTKDGEATTKRIALQECQNTTATLSDEIAQMRAKLKHVQGSTKEDSGPFGITPEQTVALITAKDWKRAGWTLLNFAMAAAVAYLSYLATNQNIAIAGAILPVATAVAQFITKKLNS